MAIADVDVAITDVDDTHLESATITLTSFQAGDSLQVSDLGALADLGISVDGSSTATHIVLTGSASLAEYQDALQLITFSNNRASPDTTDRIVEVVVHDGNADSNTAVTTVAVEAVAAPETTTLYLRILQPNHNGTNDHQNYENFTVSVDGSPVTQFIQAQGAGFSGNAEDFTFGGGNNRWVVFRIDEVPLDASISVAFDYEINNRAGNAATNRTEGPIFSIGTAPSTPVTSTAATLIANYAIDNAAAEPYNGVDSAGPRTISFDYSVSGSSVTVTSVNDPIILDLGQAGIDLSGSAAFDMDGDGQLQQLAWTTGQDGILVMDLDGSGAIESGREMFSPWFNDGDFEHALDALASLDSNGDGVIDAQDDALSQLKVWVDANGDGVSDAGELFSLTDLGIASIGLNTASGGDPIDGQTVLGLAAMAMTSSMAGRATTYSPAAPGRTSS